MSGFLSQQMSEQFLDLALEVASDASGESSLTTCLNRFTKPEDLEIGRCERCNGCSFKKQLTILQAPRVLCLHLKVERMRMKSL